MLYGSDDNARTWHKVSTYGTMEDRINETGVVGVDENTIMIVGRSFDERVTKMRISRDRGKDVGSDDRHHEVRPRGSAAEADEVSRGAGADLSDRPRPHSGAQATPTACGTRRIVEKLGR